MMMTTSYVLSVMLSRNVIKRHKHQISDMIYLQKNKFPGQTSKNTNTEKAEPNQG